MKCIAVRLGLAAVLLGLAAASPAEEPFPSRTVRLMVPWPPGGPPDLIARLAAPRAGEAWGKPVIVENRPGATGSIGTDAVAKSTPDGYTLLVTSSQPIVIAPALLRTPYDPVKDLKPLGILGESTNVLVLNPSAGIGSVAQLVAAARAKPGALTFSSSGPGSIGHLCGEMIKHMAGIDMLHVPYPGTAQAVTAVLTGEVSLNCASTQQSSAHIKSGKLKALGVTGLRASMFLPDVAPLAAQGITGLSATAWYGIFAPPKVARPVFTQIRETFRAAFREPAMRHKLEGAGIEPLWEEDDEAGARIEGDLARYRGVIQAAKIRVD